jgi:hypothetical protein
MAESLNASRPLTRVRFLLIALTVAMVLFVALITATRASGTTSLAKRVFATVDGATGALAHGSHVVSVTRSGTGLYNITFDRHMDNCAIAVSLGLERPVEPDMGPLADKLTFAVNSSPKTNIVVAAYNFDAGGTPGHQVFADSDFHLIGLCPST